MSPVVRISFLDGGSSIGASEAVLKLHDYRCLNNIRETYDKNLPWSQSKEQAYREYLAESPFPAEVFDDPFFLIDHKIHHPGVFEACLERQCQTSYKAEKETYERLKEGQGTWLPRLYNCVSMQREDGTRVDGLLFEYIPSIPLYDFIETWATRIPPLPIDLLKRICDTTVSIVNRVSNFDILNTDVRLYNFLIRESALVQNEESEPEPYPVVLVDLAQCRFRRLDETDDEWKEAKCTEDEEGAAGCVLWQKVNKCVGKDIWIYQQEYQHRRSEDSEQSPEDDVEEEGKGEEGKDEGACE